MSAAWGFGALRPGVDVNGDLLWDNIEAAYDFEMPPEDDNEPWPTWQGERPDANPADDFPLPAYYLSSLHASDSPSPLPQQHVNAPPAAPLSARYELPSPSPARPATTGFAAYDAVNYPDPAAPFFRAYNLPVPARPLQQARASQSEEQAHTAVTRRRSSAASGDPLFYHPHLRPQQATEGAARNRARPWALDDSDEDVQRLTSDSEADMPPARLPPPTARNTVVDLTQSQSPQSSAASTSRPTRSRKRSADASADDGHPKRRRVVSSQHVQDVGEENALTNEAPGAEDELMSAQQIDALKQQANGRDDGPVKIGQRTCIICLENFTNATTSHCGHIFCHECLTRALIASEKNSDRSVGNCPACRKPISRKKANQIIPINFMKKSAFDTKGRGRDLNFLG